MVSVVIATAKAAVAVFGGSAFGGGVAGALAQAVAITATTQAITRLTAKETRSEQTGLGTKEISVRSSTEYAKIIYGQALAGGTLRYTGVSGTEAQYLWRSEIIAGHEVEDMVTIKLDESFIITNDVDWATNIVDGGVYADYVKIYKSLGTTTQTVNAALAADFADITANHAAKSRALLEVRFEWVEASNAIWEQIGPPQNVLALTKGQPNIYDPRLDSSPGAAPTNSSYMAYTVNPILQLGHYLTDARLGMGNELVVADIDWSWFADEASYCEGRIPTPGVLNGAQRFTSNGILSAGDTYEENIKQLLSACDGITLQKAGPKWIARSGRFGYGPNLCTNPDFESNITGFSKLGGAGTVLHNASLKMLALTNASGGFVTSGFTLAAVAGTTYCARAVVFADSEVTAADRYGLAATYNADGQTAKLASHEITEHDAELRIQFTATTTGNIYVSLYLNSITSGKTGEFDSVEIYKVTDVTIDDDWLIDDWQLISDGSKETHYNAVDAIYLSPAEGYKPTEALRQENADYLSRDNGQLMTTDLPLNMTNTEYAAQHLAYRHLSKSDYPKTYRLPCNYKALDILPFDVVNLNIPSLSASIITARVEPVEFNDMGNPSKGIDLVVRLDDVNRYAEPSVSDYSTRTDSGEIALAISEVPDPTGLTATAKEGGILVNWANPTVPNVWEFVRVHANTEDSRAGSTLVYEGKVSEFFHKLDDGETYFYWIRARRADQFSDFLPDTETTTITATAGNQLAVAGTTANWSLVNDDLGSGEGPTRTLQDTEQLMLDAFASWLRSNIGVISGYTDNGVLTGDLFGGADGGTLLIDALDGTIDGLKYSGGTLLETLEPAQGGATANTGFFQADSFSLSATLTATASPITTWAQDIDGSAPITLVSNSKFEFDVAGLYLLTWDFHWDYRLDTDTSGSGIPATRNFQVFTRYAADGVTFDAGTNYQYVSDVRPVSATTTFVTQFESLSNSILVDAAANSRLQLHFTGVNTNGFNVSADSRVDIVLLRQVTD